jgi:hypothetical protein
MRLGHTWGLLFGKCSPLSIKRGKAPPASSVWSRPSSCEASFKKSTEVHGGKKSLVKQIPNLPKWTGIPNGMMLTLISIYQCSEQFKFFKLW